MPPTLSSTMFRAYDIRGIVGTDLSEEVYFVLGQAAGTYFLSNNRRSAAVARDARLSSPAFQAAFIQGLLTTGVDVVDIGQVATPVMYFAVENLGVDAGAIISASHNPPQFNGLKLRLAHPTYGSEPVPSEDIAALGRIALGGEFASGTGSLRQADVSDAYIQNVRECIPAFPADRRPRVVLDGGNGVAGPLALRALEALGIEVIPLYIEPDGTFPNHHPDPLKPENNIDLGRVVRENKAMLGIGLDGDGDRLGVVDSEGNMVWADQYLIVLAKERLMQRKGAVVFDVKCSAVLRDAIAALGGEPVMWKTGYTNLSQKMRELDAVVGGELSGHTILPLPGHYYDDGAFAGAYLIYALGVIGQDLREAIAPYPVLPSLDEGRIHFDEALKFKAIEYIHARFSPHYPVFDIDGVRVDFGDGWGLVRASNTEPAITTRFEATTEARVREIRDMMMGAVEEFRATMS
jgi:phosphomannomutase